MLIAGSPVSFANIKRRNSFFSFRRRSLSTLAASFLASEEPHDLLCSLGIDGRHRVRVRYLDYFDYVCMYVDIVWGIYMEQIKKQTNVTIFP